MNFSGVGRELTAVSRYARKSRETADIGSGFLKLLEKMGKAENRKCQSPTFTGSI